MVNVPSIKLNSGFDMPQIGFGLWKVDDNCPEVVYQAIKAGYRLLDGACGMSSSSTINTFFPLHDHQERLPLPRLNPCTLPLIFPALSASRTEKTATLPLQNCPSTTLTPLQSSSPTRR
jgi:hypothetical protein